MLDLGVLLRIPYVEAEMGFDVSPDGSRVAFSWNPDGNWEIFQRSLSSGMEEIMPVRLTCSPGSKFHPRYSPDGRWLAYALDLDGGEYYHIVARELASMIEIDVTAAISTFVQPFFTWSPDGKKIAFISDETGEFAVHIATLGADVPSLVFDPGHPAWKVFWSPDGLRLAVVTEASGQDYGLHIFSLDDGTATRVSLDGQPINAKDPAWSPDSRILAFSSDVYGNYQLGLYSLDSGGIEWLTNGDGQKQFPDWSPDGSRLVYTITHGSVSWIGVQSPGGSPRLVQVEPGVHYQPRFLQGGSRIIFAFDNPRHPTDLWIYTLSGGMERLTNSMPAMIVRDDFIMPEEIMYPGLDGERVPALLFLPRSMLEPGSGKPPAVLLVHGGPDWHFEMTWYPIMAHMADRGWIVLVPNYRGSTGYGRKWQTASRFDYGGVDADDVAAGALYLIQEGLADPGRIAVTGRSHGGYLTACCLTGHPELWAAGSAVVPFLDWFINHSEIRPDLQHWDLENFGDPVRDRDLWVERSPSYHLARVAAPLQLICGRNDARCPVRDSEIAYASLRKMGKETELIVYEDEGHAFLKIENVIDSEKRRIDFLARYLARGE